MKKRRKKTRKRRKKANNRRKMGRRPINRMLMETTRIKTCRMTIRIEFYSHF